jgi:predicted DNA-binding transcriptional regulator YafY
MNRTDRLYAMVEELRAVTPRPRSARWLACRFEVSARTVERDISALQQAGVPIYAEAGRCGGYVLDKAHTLPPVNVTPAEAVAIAVALEKLRGTPFHDAARAALRKVVAVMPPAEAAAAQELAARVHLVGAAPEQPVPAAVARAVTARRVLRFGYRDRHGAVTEREVEPVGYVGGPAQWYLLGWCRLRGALRAFRLDRIARPVATDEVVVPRQVSAADLDIPDEIRAPVLVG